MKNRLWGCEGAATWSYYVKLGSGKILISQTAVTEQQQANI